MLNCGSTKVTVDIYVEESVLLVATALFKSVLVPEVSLVDAALSDDEDAVVPVARLVELGTQFQWIAVLVKGSPSGNEVDQGGPIVQERARAPRVINGDISDCR
jgi:hypothetical protein